MADCVFCRIANGDLPACKVYEDESVVAFMDINPVARGHVLVIPRSHASDITGISDEEAAAIAVAIRRLAPVVAEAAQAEGFNILNNCGTAAGQVVEHVHFHIIPRKAGDGRGYRWLTLAYEQGEIDRYAEAISRGLE